ncbi:MAG TPA: FliM/FliN family flagellar motor switch protein [Rhodothermales bacterium]|nr:FliM/FliN family flagellar motor switch protein [Rhodothermales bacterium]
MIPPDLAARLSAARAPLEGFLHATLGPEVRLHLGAPAPVNGAHPAAAGGLTLHGGGGTVALSPGWTAALGRAVHGAPLEPGPDAAALVGELAAQAWGAVCDDAGGALPELTFEVGLPDAATPPLGGTLWAVAFEVEGAGEELSGTAWLRAQAAQPPAAPARHVANAPAAGPAAGVALTGGLQALAGVALEVTVELGRRALPLADVLRLTTGYLIELNRMEGEPLGLYASGRLIAEGDAVVMDERFGLRLTRLTDTP